MENKTDCVFCKIIAGEHPAAIVYSDEQIIAFKDARPIAPVHVLFIPRKHIDSVNAVVPQDEPVLGHMVVIAAKLAAQLNVDASGYRLVMNTGPHAGQSVFHLHMHLIGGRHLPFHFNDA